MSPIQYKYEKKGKAENNKLKYTVNIKMGGMKPGKSLLN